jgi:GAF domain-containing protein
MTTSATLQAVLDAAATSTGAAAAWLIAPAEHQLRLLAARGVPGAPVGDLVPSGSTFADYVLSTAQPVAVQPRADDEQAALARRLTGADVGALVSVPCAGDDDVVGVLELIRGEGAPSFDFDDVEIATMLGDVAGAAITEHVSAPEPPSPTDLTQALAGLAATDPVRYRHLAEAVAALLAIR